MRDAQGQGLGAERSSLECAARIGNAVPPALRCRTIEAARSGRSAQPPAHGLEPLRGGQRATGPHPDRARGRSFPYRRFECRAAPGRRGFRAVSEGGGCPVYEWSPDSESFVTLCFTTFIFCGGVIDDGGFRDLGASCIADRQDPGFVPLARAGPARRGSRRRRPGWRKASARSPGLAHSCGSPLGVHRAHIQGNSTSRVR